MKDKRANQKHITEIDMNTIKSCVLGMVLLAGAVMSGCKPKTDLLETVPADVAMAMTIDGNRLEAALDGASNGGAMTAEETLGKLLTNADDDTRKVVRTIALSDNIDRDMIVAFTPSVSGAGEAATAIRRGLHVVTFSIKDSEGLIAELGATAAEPQDGDFNGYTIDGCDKLTLLVRGHQGWLVARKADKAEAEVEQLLEVAGNSALRGVKGVAKYLSDNGDDVIRSVIAVSPLGGKGWTCVSAAMSDDRRELEMEVYSMDTDGRQTDYGTSLRKINTDLLRYAAPTDVVVAAIGVRGDTDWEAVMEYFNGVVPMSFHQRAIAAMVIPYLKRIDGTLIIAAGPEGDMAEDMSGKIKFFVGVELKKEEVKKTLSDVSDIIGMLGFPVSRQGDAMIWNVPGMAPVRMEVIDKRVLVVTNRVLEQLGNDAAKDVMKGNVAGVWANVPTKLAKETYGSCGFKLSMGLEDEFELKLRLNGSGAPMLEQIATIVADDSSAPVKEDADDLGFTPMDTIR